MTRRRDERLGAWWLPAKTITVVNADDRAAERMAVLVLRHAAATRREPHETGPVSAAGRLAGRRRPNFQHVAGEGHLARKINDAIDRYRRGVAL